MKRQIALAPARLLLIWALILAVAGLVPGVCRLLDIPLPASVDAVGWGLVLALLMLGVVDACLGLSQPTPRIERRIPGSLSLGRWQDVQLHIAHDHRRDLPLEVFDHVPAGFEYLDQPQRVTIPSGETAQLGYRLRAIQRGRFAFSRCEILSASPLGLWRVRQHVPVGATVRVYPDFASLFEQSLVTQGSQRQSGVHHLQRRGQGQAFHQLREFRQGDSLRQIDWKATARHTLPITREYQEERDQQIILMLDCGRRMRSQDDDLGHFDHALNACLLLAHTALHQGDAVGLATFACGHPRFLPPAKGQRQLNLMLDYLQDLSCTQRASDFAQAAATLLARQKRRALVIWVTNLRDEDDDTLHLALRQLGQRHRVLVASLREALLDQLRETPVEDYSQALEYCGTLEYLDNRRVLLERLTGSGVPIIECKPRELGGAMVSRYLAWKKAGVL